jgi:hypothetical protein
MHFCSDEAIALTTLLGGGFLTLKLYAARILATCKRAKFHRALPRKQSRPTDPPSNP